MEPKIIHTETFSCDDDHPIVWYTFDKDGKAMCEYCATHLVYEPPNTYSEEMQDKIEPIDNDYVNKILKGSGWWKNHIQNKASVTSIIFRR